MNISDFPKPHILDKLPIENLSFALQTDRDFLSEMIRAEKCLSEFIGYLNNLPTPNILITSLTLQEAVLSVFIIQLCIFRYRMNEPHVPADHRSVTNMRITAKNGCVGIDDDIIANIRMTFA